MKRMFLGKIIMFFLGVMMGISVVGIVLLTALGHIFDMHWEKLKQHFANKIAYQETSENFIFLAAYYSYVLGLDPKKSAKILINESVVKGNQEQSVRDLFIHYIKVYIPKNNKKGDFIEKQLQQALEPLKVNPEDNLRFFRLIESIFNKQVKQASPADIDMLKKIANIFNVNYQRQYKHKAQTEYKEEPKQEQSRQQYKPKQESKSSYVSQEVKSAFRLLGFKAENPPTLIKLKAEYRKKVRKYHPDILKGQQASDKKLKEAEEKLTQLNKSMDIAKNFLANS